MRRFISLVVASILLGGLLIGIAPSARAEVLVYKSGLVVDTNTGGMAITCFKRGQIFRTVKVMYICPNKGYLAYMRGGSAFSRYDTAYWKYYATRSAALTASARSSQ